MDEILEMTDPSISSLYRRHILLQKDRSVLYAELKKALYGMLQSALCFWQQVCDDLNRMGYIINPYEPSVSNRMVKGEQQTIGWHVDDFILTHEDPAVNEATIKWFRNKYSKLTKLTVHREITHELLGMTLDFTQPDNVKVMIVDYVQRMIDEASESFGE